MFDWSDARVFLAVCATQSFTAAAKELKLDQTTVGRRIAALETALGATLFRRGHAGLALTAAGEQARELAAQMQIAADSLDRRLRGQDHAEEGVVRLTTSESFARAFLVPRLAAFRERHPRVELSIKTDSRVLSLTRREADLAIRNFRPSQPGLVARKIGRIGFAFYASPSYVEGLRERSEEAYLGFEDELAAMPDAKWIGEGTGRPFALRANSRAVLESAAVAGLGVTVLPCFLGDRRDDLVRVGDRDGAMTRDLWLVVHREVQTSRCVRAVAEYVVDEVRRAREMLSGEPAKTHRG